MKGGATLPSFAHSVDGRGGAYLVVAVAVVAAIQLAWLGLPGKQPVLFTVDAT